MVYEVASPSLLFLSLFPSFLVVVTGVVGVDGTLITREIVLGADSQFKKFFNGVIGGKLLG